MLEMSKIKPISGTRAAINQLYRMDERQVVEYLIEAATLTDHQNHAIRKHAIKLVEQVRQGRKESTGIDSFLQEYSLSSDEGIALMCLAEALLRVPDKDTIDRLIKDKLSDANWSIHKGQSTRFFVNAATWALMLTGQVLSPDKVESKLKRAFMNLMNRTGETVIRKAVEKAMRIMSKQFVMGRTIDEALKRARKLEAIGYRYSYDMLGEAALTDDDALRYLEAYKKAIHAIGRQMNQNVTNIYQNAGISVKLSALHPRYQEFQRDNVLAELPQRLLELAQLAKEYQLPLTVDAEESERLDISLDVLEMVFNNDSLNGWDGFGLAVQSYQKRAWSVLDWAHDLAKKNGRRMHVRLIKGAYWDSEIKKSQMQGLADYPVFTRKVFTDVSFQACAKKLLTMTDYIYPQFATHNACSVAMILEIAGTYRDFEFQCLHGMGTELYEQIVPVTALGIPCRIYAPVGSHEDLLPYLVRRLLENGANSSFVNRIVDDKQPVSEIVHDPVSHARSSLVRINQNIPKPSHIFQPHRQNSMGMDLTDRQFRCDMQNNFEKLPDHWDATLYLSNLNKKQIYSVYSPQNKKTSIGTCMDADLQDIDNALNEAVSAYKEWSMRHVSVRKEYIERYADLLHSNEQQLIKILCLEAGKTISDAVAEVREAIDFCRYYANQAILLMNAPMEFKGYTGETNQLSLHARGIILCISPWNFPLAIFTGQIVAALVTGNCVIAKPAEQTPLIAAFALSLMHQAGIPKGVVTVLPGAGEIVGSALVKDKRINGVVFTGSTETACIINQSLANRSGEIVPLIAETGGQNCMIVDSSALLEQVVTDVLVSAFGSAGQRCSALRVLYVQEDVYPRFIRLLKGAMARLVVGDPSLLSTDVGPVIDEQARITLINHIQNMRKKYEVLYEVDINDIDSTGHFIAPIAIEINSISELLKEVFGPVLHVIKYKRTSLDQMIEEINQCGYGLTLGIHTRINETAEYIQSRIHVGNCYINRNMTGAVVGLQPFGGEGLSGTGPKAGGPHYLQRFCHERVVTIDTTAAGGNASLMAQSDS